MSSLTFLQSNTVQEFDMPLIILNCEDIEKHKKNFKIYI